MRNVVFKTTHRRQQILLWVTLIVFIVLALVGCGSEGGQADPNGHTESPPVVEGSDRKKVEFKGVDVEVQKVVVDGTTCIVASYEEAAISCDWSD